MENALWNGFLRNMALSEMNVSNSYELAQIFITTIVIFLVAYIGIHKVCFKIK